MQCKVIEFYQEFNNKKKKILKGTCHVHIDDEGLGLDLRGIDVRFNQGKPWITLPVLTKFDKELNKDVTFPVLQFSDREKTLELRRCVYKAVKAYILNNVIKKKKNCKKLLE